MSQIQVLNAQRSQMHENPVAAVAVRQSIPCVAASLWSRQVISLRSTKMSNNKHERTQARAEASFPERLHYTITELEKEGTADIVGWAVHGRCFLVRDRERFVKEVLSLYVVTHLTVALFAASL